MSESTEGWEVESACRSPHIDRNLFFPEDNKDEYQALPTCQACPVQAECILANLSENYGVWGTTVRVRKLTRALYADGLVDGAWLVGHAQRVNDETIAAQGRSSRRTAVYGQHDLSDEQIREIRELRERSGLGCSAMAALWSLPVGQVRRIYSGALRRSAGGPLTGELAATG